MSDIHYKWNDGLNSVQISSDVSLPQFKVLGHRQRTIEASLSTGTLLIECKCKYHNYNVQEIVKMISHELLISHPGNYSRLACEIQFVRSKGYYLIQVRVLGVYAKVPSLLNFHFAKDHIQPGLPMLVAFVIARHPLPYGRCHSLHTQPTCGVVP